MKPPDFIIIGAMRAGTTTLSDRLARHPDIGMSRLKETDFFIEEKNFSRGYDWYRSLFPSGKRILGEASPNYSKGDVFKGVPARIRAARSDVKLIYIVRDPVDRFWSHYAHSCLVHGGLSAPTDVLAEEEGAHILASSLYFRQFSAFVDVFPAEQLKIVDFTDLIDATEETVTDICFFLGVEPAQISSFPEKINSSEQLATTPAWALRLSQHAALTGLRSASPAWTRSVFKRVLSVVSGAHRRTPPIDAEARERVRAAVADDANRFRGLVGREFASWSV
jgi:hypothetical protein